MIPAELRGAAQEVLSKAGIAQPQKEIRLLWEKAQDNENDFQALLKRRAAREPMSHILGSRAFFENDFQVNQYVLDPRPETETLVLAALENDFQNVLDLGTGSGCILLSLLAKRSSATGLGVDLSDAALEVAQRNADVLGLNDCAKFVRSDWFEDVNGTFDLIVSNPPYIAADEMDELAPEVREYEPRLALTDEGDGLDAYRAIIDQANAFMKANGRIMVEIGLGQGDDVMDLMERAKLENIETRQDLDGRDRVIIGQKPA